MTTVDAPLLTTSQVSKRLNLNPYTVREMLRRREIKGYKIASEWRVDPQDLEAYIRSKSNQGEDNV